ncbi:MAG: AmmeMemoRadiSam system protein A [Myxococcales bacterium]|nr:AmmeMemoRadiSam system protein A [Myxococcales bacterium]
MTALTSHGPALARWARARLREELGGPHASPPVGAWAEQPAATFVSLHWPDGDLQGCIGSLTPRRPIVVDVAANAVAAGIDDPRGRRLGLADVDALELELSILSPLERIAVTTEAEAVRAIRPGVDGLVLGYHGQRGTLLPAVWDDLPEPAAFLAMLRRKAGLAPDFWSPEVELWRYTAARFVDPPRAAS